jgi:hypothetical protein
LSPAVRTRPRVVLSSVLFAVMTIVAAQLVTSAPVTSQTPRHPQRTTVHAHHTASKGTGLSAAELKEAAAAMTATIVKPITPPPAPAPAPATTTTTTTPPAPAPAPTPAPAPAPTATVAAAPAPAPSDPGVVPPVGLATAWGCGAALAYLQAYAAKGFTLECPGYAEGQEAMTCMNQAAACPGTSVIAIADPCPQAYMNEASNSFVLTGASDSPIDPDGPCP